MYDWETGSDASSPIVWRYNGKRLTTTRKDYPYEKGGDVYVVSQENITHKTESNKLVNNKWEVVLLGARSGYQNVEISPEFHSEEPVTLTIDKKYIIEEKHCEESASSNTSMYLIKFTGKKAFWLKESFSSGSAGSSYFYKIMYEEVPKCLF